ncbi:MAG: 30S ribosomal protein S9 [Patescibacteria group bacterium]
MSEPKTTLHETGRYIEAVGRRKTAVARVRISAAKSSKGSFLVNGKDVHAYFPSDDMRVIARDPLVKTKETNMFDVTVLLKGGGIHAQAEALRHGLARAIIANNEGHREPMKKAGFLERDSRAKERRKFGLKKARKAPQWSKR